MPAEYTTLLSNNPDRGWSSKEVYYVPTAGDEQFEDSYETVLAYVKNKLSVNTYDQTATVSRVFFSMKKYKTAEEIPDEAIAYMENVLKAYRELGVKVYLNIYYQAGHDDSIVTADIVLKHIDQYAPLWEDYSDVIYCYCMSLIGSWGEWTSTGNGVDDIAPMTDAEKTEIAAKVLEKLPEGMQVTMRQPMLKEKYVAEDNPRYSTIGYDQSAFFGYNYTDEDIGQSYYRPGQAAYETAIKEAPYAVMFAETFTTNWYNNHTAYKQIDALPAIKALSEQRISAFNINHGYGDIATYGGNIEDTVLYGWRLAEVSSAALSEQGVLSTDSWFTDSRGKAVSRNALEYIRDYLGYRISADTLSVTGDNNAGDSISISMDLRNYGFSAAFNLESGFAILDENNNVVSEILAGTPSAWYSTDPEDYSDRTQLTHNVTADMQLPEKAGNYKIAFFMRNKLGQTARLDNMLEYTDGFNILHMFTID